MPLRRSLLFLTEAAPLSGPDFALLLGYAPYFNAVILRPEVWPGLSDNQLAALADIRPIYRHVFPMGTEPMLGVDITPHDPGRAPYCSGLYFDELWGPIGTYQTACANWMIQAGLILSDMEYVESSAPGPTIDLITNLGSLDLRGSGTVFSPGVQLYLELLLNGGNPFTGDAELLTLWRLYTEAFYPAMQFTFGWASPAYNDLEEIGEMWLPTQHAYTAQLSLAQLASETAFLSMMAGAIVSESALTLSYDDLAKYVGHYLGYGRSSANWNTKQSDDVDAAIQDGYRQFLYPPPLPGERTAHTWNFLKLQTAQLATNAPQSTGTVTVTLDSTTVTLAGANWPSWAASGELIIAGVAYQVATRSSNSVILLANAYPGATAAGVSYQIVQSNYVLPDDYGSIDGPMVYADTNSYDKIAQTSVMQLLQDRQSVYITDRPYEFAIRPKASTGATGQRFEALLYPAPAAAYVINYQKNPLVSAKLATSVNPYPLGGMAHSETVKQSCLAAAEALLNDQQGPKFADFMRLLTASVNHDRETGVAHTLGYNGNGPRGQWPNLTPTSQRLTYMGQSG